MGLELATGLIELAAAVLTLGVVAIPLFKKTFKSVVLLHFSSAKWSRTPLPLIGANHA
jgi:hypothetical protein